MTRDEAYKITDKIFKTAEWITDCPCVSEDNFEDLVDNIYDELDNRKCEDCKF